MAQKLLQSDQEIKLNNNYLRCLLNIDYDYCDDFYEESLYSAFWILDAYTTEENVEENEVVTQQLLAFSKIIPNINSAYEGTLPDIFAYNFYFEKTELFASYPVSDACEFDFIFSMKYPYYDLHSEDCLDEEGNYYKVFEFK